MTLYDRIIASTLILLLSACGNDAITGAGSENVVNVYNWADYIAPDTIAKFQAETGIKVNYDTYAAAATVDVKLLTGNSGYDVVVHSNQYSTRLINIGVYQELDAGKIPNTVHLDADTMQRIDVYDEVRGYTVPYHWGSTGFTWNVEMVRERLPDQAMDSAAVLFDPEIVSKLADCGVSFLDGTTSTIPMALSYLGLDPNAIDDESLARVQELLLNVRPYLRYYSNDKFLIDVPNQELCLAMSWSGDYAVAARRASEANIDLDLEYTVPKEGGALWIDGLYIPADAQHVDNAHQFINFLLRPDIAADIANFVGYANANGASWEFVNTADLNDPAIYPGSEVWKRMYAIHAADPIRERMRTRTLARAKSGL